MSQSGLKETGQVQANLLYQFCSRETLITYGGRHLINVDGRIFTYNRRQNWVISENKRIRTPPLFPPFKVGVFVVFYR